MADLPEKLKLAREALAAGQVQGQESPIWWWATLAVAGSSGVKGDAFDVLFNEAVRRFPLYQPLYYTRMNYHLPQWGGSFDAVDRFVSEAVKRTSDAEGSAMYAWLYLDIARKTQEGFEGTQVS